MDNITGMEPQVAAAEVAPQQSQKMIPQAELNEIVRNAKIDAIESYKRQQAQDQSYREPVARSSITDDDVKRVAGDEIKQHFSKIQREAEERHNATEAQRIVNQFKDKVTAGRDKFADFDQVTGNVAMQHYPNVVQLLAEHTDNTAEVLYHLAQNRTKLVALESACAHYAPDAIHEVKKLADSIKANDQAAQVRNANSPLSQTRPSTTGTDSGALSFADLKRKYRG